MYIAPFITIHHAYAIASSTSVIIFIFIRVSFYDNGMCLIYPLFRLCVYVCVFVRGSVFLSVHLPVSVCAVCLVNITDWIHSSGITQSVCADKHKQRQEQKQQQEQQQQRGKAVHNIILEHNTSSVSTTLHPVCPVCCVLVVLFSSRLFNSVPS